MCNDNSRNIFLSVGKQWLCIQVLFGHNYYPSYMAPSFCFSTSMCTKLWFVQLYCRIPMANIFFSSLDFYLLGKKSFRQCVGQKISSEVCFEHGIFFAPRVPSIRTIRLALSQVLSLKIRRLVYFMSFRNGRWTLKLQSCEKVGRAGSHTAYFSFITHTFFFS